MRVVLLAACSPNVLAFKQRLFDKQADESTGPTSRSLMFATVPQKMTYSSGSGEWPLGTPLVGTQGPGAPPEGFLPLVNWQKGVKCWAPDGSNEVRF